VYLSAAGSTSRPALRTDIDIDDVLIGAAMVAARPPAKNATVAEALRRLVRRHRQQRAIADLAGLG
jgi:Arc/MetJ family transcription regulator